VITEIELNEKHEATVLEDTNVSCEMCDWNGIFKDCDVEIDSEGWEYPEYEVLVCPKCGEFSITF